MNTCLICQNIVNARISLNMTQVQMANLIGVSRQAYIKLENGKTAIINKQIVRMAQKCGLAEERILFGFLDFSDTLEALNEENEKIISEMKNKLDSLLRLVYSERRQIMAQNQLIDKQRYRIDQLINERNSLMNKLGERD